MGLAPVGGGEVHGHVGLPVAVEIVEGDTVKVVPGVGHGHGKFHAVIQQLLRPVPIESGALLVHRDHHVHALSVVGDGAAGDYQAGGCASLPRPRPRPRRRRSERGSFRRTGSGQVCCGCSCRCSFLKDGHSRQLLQAVKVLVVLAPGDLVGVIVDMR